MKVPRWSIWPIAVVATWGFYVVIAVPLSVLFGDGAVSGVRVGSAFWLGSSGLVAVGYALKWAWLRLCASLQSLGRHHGPGESSIRSRAIVFAVGFMLTVIAWWTPYFGAAILGLLLWIAGGEFLIEQYERGRGVRPPTPKSDDQW
jgi:hypothetical protein